MPPIDTFNNTPQPSPRSRIIPLVAVLVVVALGAALVFYFVYNPFQNKQPVANTASSTPQVSLAQLAVSTEIVRPSLPKGLPIDSTDKIFYAATTTSATSTVYSVQLISSFNTVSNYSVYKNFFIKNGWKITDDQNKLASFKKLVASKNKSILEVGFGPAPIIFKNDLSANTPAGIILTSDILISIKYTKPL